MPLLCLDERLICLVAGTQCTTSHGEIMGYWQVMGSSGHGRVLGIDKSLYWLKVLTQIGHTKNRLDMGTIE
jgi:hypothetical protein